MGIFSALAEPSQANQWSSPLSVHEGGGPISSALAVVSHPLRSESQLPDGYWLMQSCLEEALAIRQDCSDTDWIATLKVQLSDLIFFWPCQEGHCFSILQMQRAIGLAVIRNLHPLFILQGMALLYNAAPISICSYACCARCLYCFETGIKEAQST